jgi:predicted  nucleic acid-binding Zn-ribbon protein
METMVRDNWTDDRLDDLNKKVDDGFARLDGDIRELRGEIKDLRGEVTALRTEMHERFESLNRTLIGAAVAIVAALIGSNAF